MNFSNAPRQPFVGLALMAATGIISANFFPLSPSALLATAIAVVICAVALLRWPNLIATYVIVGSGFFLLHGLRTSNTEGEQLAVELGSRPRIVVATGFIISEPKIAPNGFATFLLRLELIELEGRTQPARAVWRVRWRGTPEFGDACGFSELQESSRRREIRANSICAPILRGGTFVACCLFAIRKMAR